MNAMLIAYMGAAMMLTAKKKKGYAAGREPSPDGNCPGCGAPLDPSISPQVLVIECEYCNRKVSMR